MNVLILKLGATGDVLRTTPLLHKLPGRVSWVTAAKNVPLLQDLGRDVRCVPWEGRQEVCDTSYELVINLEDTLETGSFLNELKFKRLFGAFVGPNQDLQYSDDSRAWFDLSLISRFGRQEADRLKLQNRRTYQAMLFSGLGFEFRGEPYLLPKPYRTDLAGDVAIAPEAGPVWPMKNWAYYEELKAELESAGLRVNLLPFRASLLEHLGDVSQHRCLVGGDSLPMHMALGSGTRCVSLFTCTSPWEIHDYGLQRKIVSPLLSEFFYKRHFDPRATTAITLEQVRQAVFEQLGMPARVQDRVLA
jgi:heptosyltransferase-2